jgi:cytidylate kinase
MIENIDEPTARRRLPEVDPARAQYVRRLYDADIDDQDLFHLHIDSTALPLDPARRANLAADSRRRQ